ncbi:Protein kinase, ATP binding site-containing protein [Artemisia annua]|uniref:Protein kinase, ATP binding site-containing protein n=1 Tax=Artemisia annua TaxID=35608 RepID=A0A2U1KW18_ARTAN|nr:Protein kinase, ATP binding site-containing protein [Artemisia annua]
MSSLSVDLKKFRIPLEELKCATDNFDCDFAVTDDSYLGELSERWQNRTALFKRFNKEEYGSHELEILSRLQHEDIISFIGYCDEDDDYIYMAYEYFDHRSLHDVLKSESKWPFRLQICIRVAKVLNYLHSGVGEHGRVIHGNIRCENIFFDCRDDKFDTIKVSGFYYSKLVPLNQPHQHHSCPEELLEMSHTDPIYKETNLLNTESDVYSFGVLMFEILHGIGSESGDVRNLHQLMNLVRGCYDDGPYKLTDPYLRGNTNHRSLKIFSTLAYKCISFDIKERPRMDEIIKTIEKAFDVHQVSLFIRW